MNNPTVPNALIKWALDLEEEDKMHVKISVNTLILLEKIGSPLAGTASGEAPVFDCPVTEIARAWYVIKNQDRPNLTAIFRDEQAFDNAVSEMTNGMEMEDFHKITAAMMAAMARFRGIAVDLGILVDKEETGEDGGEVPNDEAPTG